MASPPTWIRPCPIEIRVSATDPPRNGWQPQAWMRRPRCWSRASVWVHEIRTSTWFIDLTIPATVTVSDRPSMITNHYQWDALTNPDGPDYELWRVAGDITEVCQLIVSCGIHELRAQMPQGLLEIEYVMEADGIRVTMDDVEMEWLSLD